MDRKRHKSRQFGRVGALCTPFPAARRKPVDAKRHKSRQFGRIGALCTPLPAAQIFLSKRRRSSDCTDTSTTSPRVLMRTGYHFTGVFNEIYTAKSYAITRAGYHFTFPLFLILSFALTAAAPVISAAVGAKENGSTVLRHFHLTQCFLTARFFISVQHRKAYTISNKLPRLLKFLSLYSTISHSFYTSFFFVRSSRFLQTGCFRCPTLSNAINQTTLNLPAFMPPNNA